MGWDFYSNPRFNKAAIVAEKVAGDDMMWGGERGKILAHALRGQTLYRVVERPDGQRFIAVDLLKSGGRGEGWGSKGMSESMGPWEAECPLYFFGLVPCPGGYAVEWRARCRENAHGKSQRAKRAKGLVAGMMVSIYGNRYKLVSKRVGKPGWIVEDANGNRYRAARGIVPVAADEGDKA